MAQFKRITRDEAIDYLNTSANWQELRQHNRRIKPAADLSTDIARRYANALRRKEATGGWIHDLAELRGHTVTEHHAGRGRKRGFENYQRPEKTPRMFNEQVFFAAVDRQGRRIRKEARLTVTSGESVAVRALNQAIMSGQTIALTLTGPLAGQKKSIFWRGGYDPRLLLAAAGYHVTRTGRYAKIPGASLERWLLNYIARMAPSPTTERWPFIALYQIYAAETISEVDLVPQDHARNYYIYKPGFAHTPIEVAPPAWPSWVKSHGGKG